MRATPSRHAIDKSKQSRFRSEQALGIGRIADALRLYLSDWADLKLQRGVGTIFVHYDVFNGADASLAETAEEVAAFEDRYMKAACVKIRGSEIELVWYREIGKREDGTRVVGNEGRAKWDLADPESLEFCIATLHQYLKKLGYQHERPPFE